MSPTIRYLLEGVHKTNDGMRLAIMIFAGAMLGILVSPPYIIQGLLGLLLTYAIVLYLVGRFYNK